MKHKKSNWEKLIIIKITNKNLYSGEWRKVQLDYVDIDLWPIPRRVLCLHMRYINEIITTSLINTYD